MVKNINQVVSQMSTEVMIAVVIVFLQLSDSSIDVVVKSKLISKITAIAICNSYH